MQTVSGQYLQAIRSSFQPYIEVDLFFDGGTLEYYKPLPIQGGTVSTDITQDARRTATLQVALPDTLQDLVPYLGDDPLAPYGSEVQLWGGITYPDHSVEKVPMGRLRIEQAVVTQASRLVTLTCADKVKTIQDARFLALVNNSVPTNTIAQEIQRLATGATINHPVLIDQTAGAADVLVGAIAWGDDCWGAMRDMATSIGAELVYDVQDNNLILRPVPTLADPVVWTIDAGATGVLVSAQRTMTRDGAYSLVVARSDPTDGSAPVTGIAYDLDPDSATYVGRFGYVPRFYSSPLIKTTTQATSAAKSLLAKSTGYAFSVAFGSVPNHALDGGDVVELVYSDGRAERHLVQSLAVDLGTGAMTGTTQSNKPQVVAS